MKTQKILFNHLIIQYKRYSNKLQRLCEKGLNFRKQEILAKRIKKIAQQLTSIKYSIRKLSALGAMAGAMVLFSSNEVKSQNFDPAQINPFSIINNPGSTDVTCSFSDLDNDGDLDMMIGDYSFNFAYYENIGSSTSPTFSAPVQNPFSLTGSYDGIDLYRLRFSFADLDNDGDDDIMAGNSYGKFYYYQNNGTAVSPNFASPVENPFSISASLYVNSSATLADLDSDGDFDMISGSGYSGFYYFENVGNASTPNFNAGVNNPFLLTVPFPDFSNSIPSLGDLDGDGDFDLISSFTLGNYFVYYENDGTSSSPSFGSLQENPFQIGQGDYLQSPSPTFVDIDGDGNLDVMSGSYYGQIFFYENTNCGVISTSVLLEEGTFTIEETIGATYQWLDCDNGNSAISGETNQSFNPSVAGNYAVEIDLGGGCIDVSECYEVTACDVLEEPINTEISIDGATLTSEQADATYQWTDCDNSFLPIDGETDQSFTTTESGNYNVVINLNGCEISSSCFNVTVCDSISLSTNVAITGDLMSAEQTGAIYQWVDCGNGNEPIEGETNQQFTATITGSYAVEITIGDCNALSNCYDVTVCDGTIVNADVTQDGSTLTLVEESDIALYQWIDCDNDSLNVLGETEPSFTAVIDGTYAIEVTINGCIGISDCIDLIGIGLQENTYFNDIKLYPNPTKGKLNMAIEKNLNDASISIVSVTGKVVFEKKNISGSNVELEISDCAEGLYFLELRENENVIRIKLIKE